MLFYSILFYSTLFFIPLYSTYSFVFDTTLTLLVYFIFQGKWHTNTELLWQPRVLLGWVDIRCLEQRHQHMCLNIHFVCKMCGTCKPCHFLFFQSAWELGLSWRLPLLSNQEPRSPWRRNFQQRHAWKNCVHVCVIAMLECTCNPSTFKINNKDAKCKRPLSDSYMPLAIKHSRLYWKHSWLQRP